jgi:hypothetical protein
MLTISKPLSAGQAQSYHQSEFTAEEQLGPLCTTPLHYEGMKFFKHS